MLQLPFFHPTVFFSDVFFSYGTYNKTKDLTKLRGPPPPLRQPHNDPYYCFTSRWHLLLTTPPVLFPPFWFLVGLISLVTTVFCIQYIFFFSDKNAQSTASAFISQKSAQVAVVGRGHRTWLRAPVSPASCLRSDEPPR